MTTVVAAVVERDGRFLITRRLEGTHLAGLWEFPGGKVHAGEDHPAALRREMLEELDAGVIVGDKLHEVTFAYSERSVELHFYRCTLSGTPRPLLGQEMRWVSGKDLPELPFPEADRELIERLSQSTATGTGSD